MGSSRSSCILPAGLLVTVVIRQVLMVILLYCVLGPRLFDAINDLSLL